MLQCLLYCQKTKMKFQREPQLQYSYSRVAPFKQYGDNIHTSSMHAAYDGCFWYIVTGLLLVYHTDLDIWPCEGAL